MKLIWHKHPRLYNCTTNVCSVICLDPYYLNSIFRSSVITESWRDFRCNWIATEKKNITNGISAQSFDRIGSGDISKLFQTPLAESASESCVTIFIRGISSKHHRKSRLDAHFNIAGWVARFFLFPCRASPLLSAGVIWAVAKTTEFPFLRHVSSYCLQTAVLSLREASASHDCYKI